MLRNYQIDENSIIRCAAETNEKKSGFDVNISAVEDDGRNGSQREWSLLSTML